METKGRRESDNFEDRGEGSRMAGGGGGGFAGNALMALVQTFGLKGVLVVGGLLGVGYLVAPTSVKHVISGLLSGSDASSGSAGTGQSTCAASPENDKACHFSRVVLASTEEVWAAEFKGSRLPDYRQQHGPYVLPKLVVFSDSVETGGCGNATSGVGPFYCPGDSKLYLDPTFYELMARRLKSPGDFAQAYVIAHEVGHHVQNLIGANKIGREGETRNQTSVRLELQADCFAGVWGHTARASLSITEADLAEALNAAHNIGDDALGHSNVAQYTHGTSAERMKWFRRGFDAGDPGKCDTFGVASVDD